MGRSRRMVEHNDIRRGGSRGRSPKLWAYGYADLARLLGTTEGALRARVARGTAFPGDLEWVCNQHHMYVERCDEEIRRREAEKVAKSLLDGDWSTGGS